MKNLITLLSFFLCAFISYAQNRNLDSLLISYEKENQAMGNVSILRDGTPFYAKSIGYSNIELDKKNNTETLPIA